jgi:LuxR family maltose regulon positive regulatory protein
MNPRSASPEYSPLAQALKLLGNETNYRLALLIAPAGSGKTKVLRHWVNTHPQTQVAWVGLLEEHNAPPLFFKALCSALQGLNTRITALFSPSDGKAEAFDLEERTIELINALTVVAQDYFLILDNYQVIESTQIHAAVSLLLDYQPQKMHLVIASHSDPPLPVPRLRVRRQLIELGLEELQRSSE